MNIEKWIKENSSPCNDEFGMEDDSWKVISESSLRELLKTHAIVPREPSDKILAAIERDNKYKDFNFALKQYNCAIKAAESEQ